MTKQFHWVEGVATVTELVKSLAVQLAGSESETWYLKEPASVEEVVDFCILETTNGAGSKFYLKLRRPTDSFNHLMLQIGTEFDETTKDLGGKRSAEAKLSWYRENADLHLEDWLPIQYWISFSSQFINLVVQGEPSLDTTSYSDHLISYGYAGALAGYGGADEDLANNFALTCGSNSVEGSDSSGLFGNRTGTGVTDIAMAGTRTGTPYQAHYPSFFAGNPFTDRNFVSASAWTHKHHFSPVVVSRPCDRERGMLQNMIIGDRSAVSHLEELIRDKGRETEEVYKVFHINAPYSFLNNGSNVLYGIALRKS